MLSFDFVASSLVTHTAVLSSGKQALVLLAPRSAGGREAQAALQLETPRGLLVLNGGTEEPSPEIDARLRSLLRDGLAPVVIEQRLTVVTGGTDAGIFRLFGEALAGRGRAPCIGVVPANLVARAPAEAADGETVAESRVPLEPHHTHFVLVEGGQWGDETEVMLSLVDALSAGAASLAVLADQIADVVTGRASPDDAEMIEIVAGRITVLDPQASPSALAELVRARLGLSEKPRRTLRSVPLFAPLPRLRWRPVPGQPFVSESTLARCPALREEIELLERELVPRFRVLDYASLRTQNTFRLGQLALIVGGALAAVLGAVQAALGGGFVALAFPEAVLAGLLAGATVYIRGRNAQREYFTSRLRAERLRAEYFLILARAGDYAGVEDGERLPQLRRRIRAIEERGDES